MPMQAHEIETLIKKAFPDAKITIEQGFQSGFVEKFLCYSSNKARWFHLHNL